MKQILSTVALLVLLLFGARDTVFAHDGPHITVQPGDTLSEIAKQNNTDVATLRRLNNMSNIDVIQSGGQLALPNADSANAPPSTATSIAEHSYNDHSSTISDQQSYIVQPGDTLSDIAQRHRLTLALLVEVNQISPAQRLYVGQELQIPDESQRIRQILPVEHIVQYGENLGMIAGQYGVSLTELMQINSLADSNLLVPGQRLQLNPGTSLDNSSVSQVSNLQSSVELSISLHQAPPTLEKWIDVDLSAQTVTAYEGAVPVNHFIISSGLPGTPTVTGEFRIWAKTSIQDMYGGNRASGDYYYLEDVQWVQYFFEDYAFHAAYWHNNFGQPMSRGCINMRTEDAKWLFDWASPQSLYSGWLMSDVANPGTLVIVHE
jgi:LysM repeat protein